MFSKTHSDESVVNLRTRMKNSFDHQFIVQSFITANMSNSHSSDVKIKMFRSLLFVFIQKYKEIITVI